MDSSPYLYIKISYHFQKKISFMDYENNIYKGREDVKKEKKKGQNLRQTHDVYSQLNLKKGHGQLLFSIYKAATQLGGNF